MASRKTFSAALAFGLIASTAAMAGSLPSVKQIGCWNKVVVSCERTADVDQRAVCQFSGFSACNKAIEYDESVSIERIREALPSVTSTRIIVKQSSAQDLTQAAEIQ